MALRQPADGIREGRQQPCDLAATASGQHDEQGRGGGNAVPGTKSRAVAGGSVALDHRMADIARLQPDLFEVGRLERQQGQQVIDGAGGVPRAEFAPRPDHRRDVVDHRRPRRQRRPGNAAQPLADTKAETRTVDGHHGDRLEPPDVVDGLAHMPQDPSGTGQHLEDTHDRKLADRHAADDPFLCHLVAADAGEPDMAAEPAPERAHQRGAESIPRRFTRDQVE
jgi:hypothetical protein